MPFEPQHTGDKGTILAVFEGSSNNFSQLLPSPLMKAGYDTYPLTEVETVRKLNELETVASQSLGAKYLTRHSAGSDFEIVQIFSLRRKHDTTPRRN
jgi:hypothetical protein